MDLFKDILKEGESLFKNPVTLDFDYTPKIFKYREKEQELMVSCIKPLLIKKNGRNLIITGKPGIGKTLACKKVLEALEEEELPPEAEEVNTFYINCWKTNTSYKIFLELCEKINYRFIQNKNKEDLFRVLKGILNKKSNVFVFDEIDKIEDYDFLYMFLEEIYRKSIFLITNYREFGLNLDMRIKSRLVPEIINFKPYNLNEIKGILKERIKKAFYDEIWNENAFEKIAKKTNEHEDIRSGLFWIKHAGETAESESSRKINNEHVEKSIEKLEDFSVKNSETLEDENRFILNLIKNEKEIKSGDLFKLYCSEGGKLAYRSFQRKIKDLKKNRFISVKKIDGGPEGTTSVISCNKVKKITDF